MLTVHKTQIAYASKLRARMLGAVALAMRSRELIYYGQACEMMGGRFNEKTIK